MAERKKTTRSASSKKSTSSKKPTKAEIERQNENDRVLWSVVTFAAGVLTAFFAAVKGEAAWLAVHNMVLGMFGVATVLVPLILIYVSLMIAAAKEKHMIAGRAIQGAILVLICCALVEIFFAEPFDRENSLSNIINDLYINGKEFKGGGLFAAVLGVPLIKLFGRTGAGLISVLLTFVFGMLLANKTVVDLFRFIRNIFAAAGAARPEYEEVEDFVPPPGAKRAAKPEKAPKKKLFGDKVPPNSDVPASVAEKTQKDFEIDIPIPGGTVPATGKKKSDPTVQLSAENDGEEKQKSAVELEADAIARSVEEKEAERQAAKAAAKTAQTAQNAAPEAQEKGKNDLLSIIKNAAARNNNTSESTASAAAHSAPVPNAVSQPHPQMNQHANQQANQPSPMVKRPEKLKGSTLASNKIGDDEDLDLQTTAQDIQNEIVENIPAAVEYVRPPVELLKPSSNESNSEEAEVEMKQNASTLVETLESFGVKTRIVDIHRGPTVTRYELQPAAGVKIARITGLADDIALNLAAEGVRIQAPIPGKAAVGIEVPNRVKDIVTLRDVIDTEKFRNAKSKLTFAVGKNIDGDIILGDIAELPHMIIAGTTGSGKSVCTNGIIMSILYNASPDEVRLVLIDPKVVEFKIYDGIPHLLIPVVTDPRKAAGALAWAVQEMLKRYKLFADNNVRDLKDYNEMAAVTDGVEPLPRIVIIIDEFADLMMAAAGEVEDSVQRLTQMARAAGMHLIIATQRPTVDVITGVIKANIGSRIALRVSSGIDSRSIINEQGAEKLLGHGDLLYFPAGYAKPLRVQNCYTSVKEVEATVSFIKNGAGDVTYSDDIMKEIEQNIPQPKDAKDKPQDNGKTYDGGDENVIERAMECAVDAGTAGVSVSYFQRKLKLGYARAARIMDELEEMGVVGPYEGAKPRQVLMTREMFLQRKLSGNAAASEGYEEMPDNEDVPFDE